MRSEWIRGSWGIHRIRRVSPRELRGKPIAYPKRALFLLHDVAFNHFDPKNHYRHHYYLTCDGGKSWGVMYHQEFKIVSNGNVALSYRPVYKEATQSQYEEDFHLWDLIFLRNALRRILLDEIAWTIHLERFPFRFLIHASDVSARELISMRDIESGTRRAAARHWVKEHYRKTQHSPALVKAHLRGQTEFRWGDWICSLRESQFDRSALQKGRLPTQSIERRSEWRVKAFR